MAETVVHMKSILSQEVEGFGGAVERAEAIRNDIFKHDWKKLSQNLEKMEKLSTYLAALEKERVHIFENLRRELGAKENDGFYTVVVRLPEEEQNELSDLFRRLKSLVLQLQGVLWSVDAYTRSLSGTIYDIL
ncbi:MAG TPA: hypothetical protein ENN41_07215, partial [Sediminispirochaeta sp.]|nr:hypothetical protein [Sediminispirochaeta sp.]